jgi:ferredoxin
MSVKTTRKIVKIDEEKCNGCGVCIPACAEGALKIINGKAKLVSESYCDGLGACLGECPQGAITIEEREATGFDEEAVKLYHENKTDKENLVSGCSSAAIAQFEKSTSGETADQPSMLRHWPVQLTRVPPDAPFLQKADVVLAADCVPFALANFHSRFLKDHSLLIACPKLDDFQAHLAKLTDILKQSSIKSLTVVHMEVPCCSGLVHMARQAIQQSGKKIPLSEVTISAEGEILTAAH